MKKSVTFIFSILFLLNSVFCQESSVLLSPQYSTGFSFGNFVEEIEMKTFSKRGLLQGGVLILGIERNERFRLGLNLARTNVLFSPNIQFVNISSQWELSDRTFSSIQLNNMQMLGVNLTIINLGVNLQHKVFERGGFKFWLNNMLGTETIINKEFEVIGTGFVSIEGLETEIVINKIFKFDYQKSNVAGFYIETGFQAEYKILSNIDIFVRPQVRLIEHREKDYFGMEGLNDFREIFPEDNLWFGGFSFNIGLNFRI